MMRLPSALMSRTVTASMPGQTVSLVSKMLMTHLVGAAVGVTGAGVGETGAGVGVTGAGVGVTGALVGVTGAGVGVTGAGVGVTGAGVGVTGAFVGVTGAGVGVTGAGVGVTGAGVGTTTDAGSDAVTCLPESEPVPTTVALMGPSLVTDVNPVTVRPEKYRTSPGHI